MAGIITSPWYSQPQFPVGVNWGNPITKQLVYASNFGAGNLVTSTTPLTKIPTERGVASSWVRTTVNPINTGIVNSNVVGHTFFGLMRHPSLLSTTSEAYITNRVTTNTGFSFYTYSASGSFPVQTFKLGYVHGGVLAYESNINITGSNTRFVPIAISATVNSFVNYYADGAFLDSVATTNITNNSDTLRVGAEPIASSQWPANYDTPLMCYWTRALSAAEIATISVNPWQLFAPLTRRLWAPAATVTTSYTLMGQACL